MNIIDLRNSLQESSTIKRIAERRGNPHEFGTPEWLEYLTQNGLECPTHDRRKPVERRGHEHRQAESENPPEKPYKRILLTAAEKKLIEDLYLTDLD
jgi:hypothetical protein